MEPGDEAIFADVDILKDDYKSTSRRKRLECIIPPKTGKKQGLALVHTSCFVQLSVVLCYLGAWSKFCSHPFMFTL